jgi:hygromycin-B 4-O-kinase
MKKKRPAVTADVAAEVLRHHFGTRPRQVKVVHGGLNNHVFEARLGGQELIVRISRQPDHLQTFMKEQWAVNAARRKRVPTPEILEVCNDVIELPYMISLKVHGRPATNVGRMRHAVIEELGHYAAVINSIRTSDFGHIFDWSPNKLSRNGSWQEYLDKELCVEDRLAVMRNSRVLEPRVFKRLAASVKAIRRWDLRPVLTHGDIRLKNVILNEDRKISTILDWENCTSNVAPYWELSIALHDLTMDEKEIFLRGYGIELKQFVEMAPAIKTINILNYAPVISAALERNDREQLAHLRGRLNGAFDLYSL